MNEDRVEGGAAAGSRRVPITALVLGGAGLLPPLLAIFARLSAGAGAEPQLARFAMVVGLDYVALILSFLGGIWWGVAAARLPADRIGPLIAISVLPSLAALAIHILSNWFPGPSVVLLAVAIVATLAVDRRLVADGLMPRWWMRLRVPLSAGLAVLTLGLAALL